LKGPGPAAKVAGVKSFRPLVALTLLFLTAAGSWAAPRPPNVIFFLIDDWGWTDGGTFGSKFYETPNIDRLAREGMKFTQAYAACTVCSPTRAAVMTGKYPARLHLTDWIAGHNRPFAKLKIPDWQMHLPLEETTIAEALKVRGYATAIFGKWHLGNEEFFPDKQGFDVNFGGCSVGAPRSYFPPYGVPNITDEKPGEMLSDRLTREAIKFIETNRDRPFYVYFPHYAVHQPIAGKPEVIAKYRQKLETQKSNHTNPVYAALVESVDDSVGAVLRRLAELNLADNTVIFLTGDNGGLSGTVNSQGWREGPTRNDPLRLGKGSAYEGGVRVPLVVKWPGVTKPGSVNESTPVISVDYFPTILQMAGAPAPRPGAVDGETIVPLLQGRTALQRDAIFWHYPHYHPGSATPYSAIREGDWKLIEFYEDRHLELYNLRAEIGEKTELSGRHPDVAARLRAKLDAWRVAVGAQEPTPNPKYDPAKAFDGEGAAGKAAAKGKKTKGG
jgi:arylsulfatase A